MDRDGFYDIKNLKLSPFFHFSSLGCFPHPLILVKEMPNEKKKNFPGKNREKKELSRKKKSHFGETSSFLPFAQIVNIFTIWLVFLIWFSLQRHILLMNHLTNTSNEPSYLCATNIRISNMENWPLYQKQPTLLQPSVLFMLLKFLLQVSSSTFLTRLGLWDIL